MSAAIGPAQKPSQTTPYDGRDEPVSAFVPLHDLYSLIFAEKTMDRYKVLSTDGYFFLMIGLDIEQPVAMPAESVDYHYFRSFFAKIHYLEDSVPERSGLSTHVSQHQGALIEEPS